jgi:hypothetical protein
MYVFSPFTKYALNILQPWHNPEGASVQPRLIPGCGTAMHGRMYGECMLLHKASNG